MGAPRTAKSGKSPLRDLHASHNHAAFAQTGIIRRIGS
jgi:hypothetical protein